jgi:hypothetical protein
VFALRNGQPVLKWVCGNPLSKFLPPVVVVVPHHKVKVSPYLQALTPSDTENIIVPADVYQPVIPIGAGYGSSALNFGNALFPGLLGLILIAPHGGGGGGGGTPPLPVVPEAATVVYVLIALPLAFLLARRYRSASRSNHM